MPSKRQKLVVKLDKIFSQYIRLRKTDQDGFGFCYTCDKKIHWRKVDAGHFMGRGSMNTRWDEENVQFQCKGCNGFRSGEQWVYSQRLDYEYGNGTAATLFSLSKQTRKFGEIDLKEMIIEYSMKVNELKNERGIQ